MVKIFWLLTSALLLAASPSWAVLRGSQSAGDSCTGTLLFAAHMENDDVTQGTPAGCVVSGGDNTITKTGVSYSTTQKSDGSYASYSTAENSSMVISSTNMDVSITGTWCGDIYYTQTVNRRVFTINTTPVLTGIVVYSAGANTLRTNYNASGYTGSDTFANYTFVRACFSWDTSGAGATDKLATKLNTSAWQEQTNFTITDISNPATYYVTGGSFQYYPGYIDNVKLYSDYKHVE